MFERIRFGIAFFAKVSAKSRVNFSLKFFKLNL